MLLTPTATGVTTLVWIIPVVALVLAIAGLAVAFRRWKRKGDVHATAADRELVGRALADGSPPTAGWLDDDPEMGSGR